MEHGELIIEMGDIEKLTTQERLRLARYGQLYFCFVDPTYLIDLVRMIRLLQ